MNNLSAFYKNMSGISLIINDMNCWRIEDGEEIAISQISGDALQRSIDFQRFVAKGYLVPIQRVAPVSRISLPPPQVAMTPETIRMIAQEIGKEIAKEMGKTTEESIIEKVIQMLPSTPTASAPAPTPWIAPPDPVSEYNRQLDTKKLEIMQTLMDERADSKDSLHAEVEETIENTEDMTRNLRDVLGTKPV